MADRDKLDPPPPLPEPEVQGQVDPFKAGRTCQKCGGEARIVSNQYGIQAYCDSCKLDWPISNPAVYNIPPILPGRGFHKVTLVDFSFSGDMGKLYGGK